MAIDEGLYAWVQEALEPLGSVTLRKMMGGATLYLDGTIFAIMVDGELWMKSDAEADAIWDTVSTERFTVTFKDGTVDSMNYRRAPSDVYDDAEAMQKWVSVSVEAGRRRVVKKRPRAVRPQMRRDLGALLDRAEEARLHPAVRGLLIGIAERQDARIVPAGADEGQADRKPAHLAHRHGEVGIAGDGGEIAGAAARESGRR